MTELEVELGTGVSETAIDRMCRGLSLTVTMKGTLSKYPGSVHWHLKKGREKGTLEITLWPDRKRLWFSMQDGRKGEWVLDAARTFKSKLESRTK